MARLGSQRLAQGARLTRPPLPPDARSQWLLAAGTPLSRQAGTGEDKAGRGENAEIAKGQGLPRCQEADRHPLGQACSVPQSGSKRRKCRSGHEIHIGFFQQGRLQQGTEARSGPLPRAPCYLAPLRPLPQASPGPAAVCSKSQRGDGTLDTGEAAASAPRFAPVTWGRGGCAAETGTLSLPLSPSPSSA